MSFPEPRLNRTTKWNSDAPRARCGPAGPESKQAVNVKTPSQAESLLAAEKRTLEMMANGASLSEVLNDLCASIDAHAPPVASMVCLMDRTARSCSRVPALIFPPHLRLPSHLADWS